MKFIITNLFIFILCFNVNAGGEYGGGPKLVKLHKLDFGVKIGDLSLSRDKERVKLEISYKKKRTEFDPFVGEKEAQRLLYGKYSTFTLEYDKNDLPSHVVDKLEKRSFFTIFNSKYKELARENFSIEEVTEQMNKAENAKYYEVQLK
ncbi:hypothetical protein [Halobacteriovorax sp.]|uniref:hypothetical protein n=1 Tax=Halobacteriovorax sp. TaxID=2020862 RepID=UPI00356A85E1